MKEFTVGTRVFCDFHFGPKPPGRVVEVVKEGDGQRNSGEVRVQITASTAQHFAGFYEPGRV